MQKNKEKVRCSAFISTENYGRMSKVMKEETLINMSMSKGALLDMGLTLLYKRLASGTDINKIAIEHLQFLEGGIDGI